MILKRSQAFHATLHVSHREVFLLWSRGEQSGLSVVPLASEESSPQGIALSALTTLAVSVPGLKESDIARCRWRLVLPGGFYAAASRPTGRWSHDLAQASATELEAVCPVPLDELQTAAIPISSENAWVCGLSQKLLTAWQEAFEASEMHLEGVWTQAGAIVDWTIECELPANYGALYWQDGRVRVEMIPAAANPIGSRATPSIAKVRVYAHWEEAGSEGFILPEKDNCPLVHLPAWAAHHLAQIDPAEGLNLLRGDYRSQPLERSNQRELASAMAMWMTGCLLLAAGNLASANASQKQSAQSQLQIASVWHQAHGAVPLAPLPVTTLEQQAANWRSIRTTLPALASTRPSVAVTWATLIKALPADLNITLSSLRTRGQELWIEGQVPSQADARTLEAAWHTLSSLKTDPMRLSAGSGGAVNFSVRMVMR